MSKLDELQNLIATLFEKAEDKSVIEQVGAVNSKIKELKEEETASATQYKELLDQYKDAVIHTSSTTKPTDAGAPSVQSLDQLLTETLLKASH